MAQPLASAVDDWCKLLQSRVKEAENYYPIACDEDKRLIDLYLPSLSGTKNPLESLQQCQWKPSSASGIRNYTHSIILHVKDHIHKIPVTEVAKSICGFRSRGIESPKACARCIRLSYQYSPELLRAIETVSSIAAQKNITSNRMVRNLSLNIHLCTLSSGKMGSTRSLLQSKTCLLVRMSL